MSRYRNKLVYNADTGEIRDDKKFMSMLEDFWLPRREGGRGTEITTLPGGQNLGEPEDVKYFQKKLYRSLNVPESRWNLTLPLTLVDPQRSPAMKLNSKNSSLDSAKSLLMSSMICSRLNLF